MLLIRALRRSKRLWLSARLQRKPPSGDRCLPLFNHLTMEGKSSRSVYQLRYKVLSNPGNAKACVMRAFMTIRMSAGGGS